MSHGAFLKQIIENPADDSPRSVYADWLEERGDPRAEFLRLQLRLHSSDKDDQQRNEIREQLRRLARKFDRDWVMQLELTSIENCPRTGKRRRQIEFEFACPRQWDQLEPTDDDEIRTCQVCREYVFYCRSVREAQHLAAFGACVAIDSTVEREANDLQLRISFAKGIVAIPRRLQQRGITSLAEVHARRKRS